MDCKLVITVIIDGANDFCYHLVAISYVSFQCSLFWAGEGQLTARKFFINLT